MESPAQPRERSMGAPKKADWREERRKQLGWKQHEIAQALGVSEGAVSQWMKRVREAGEEALKAHPPKGVPSRMTPEQQAKMPQLLARGAEAYGFRGDVWTARRVAKVIEKTFGVRYSRDHVGFLLRKLGWSRQKPIERATQRNETARENWQQERFPALKKAEIEGRTIIFVDEAGFYLLPMAVRTWAPRRHTPILKVKLTRDHLSAMSGITLDGRLFMQVRQTSYDSQAVIGFLRVLLRQVPGKLLIIWDGSPIHRSREIKAFLKRGAAKRLHLEQLPGYAPDLNPDEGIWQYLKRVEMGTLCCRDLDHLYQELIRARERLRHKRDIIEACSRQCGYVV
jgi:transposase